MFHRKWSSMTGSLLLILVCGCAGTRHRAVSDETLQLATNTKYDTDGTSTRRDVPPAGPIWTCPMHLAVQQASPGKCPMCGMDLVRSDGVSAGLESSSQASHSHSSGSQSAHSGGSCCH
jgi:hypothetical protein